MKHHECEHCERAIIYECDSFTLEAVRLENIWTLHKKLIQKREPSYRRWGCYGGDDDGA